MLFLLDPAATYLSMTVRHGRGASGHWPFLPLPAFSSSAALLLPLAAGSSAVSPAPCAGLPAWENTSFPKPQKKSTRRVLSFCGSGSYLSFHDCAAWSRRVGPLALPSAPCLQQLRCPSSATGSGRRPCVASTLCWLTDMGEINCFRSKAKGMAKGHAFCFGSGSYLSFHAVASTVFSAYKGLTSVFGMGTGGSP